MQPVQIVGLVGIIVFVLGTLINLGFVAATPFAGLKVAGLASGSVLMIIGVITVVTILILSTTGVVDLELFTNPDEEEPRSP